MHFNAHNYLSSFSLGTSLGVVSLAVPSEIGSFLGKLIMGVAIAVLTGVIHGLAKRFAGGDEERPKRWTGGGEK
jgi:hypothetical protein